MSHSELSQRFKTVAVVGVGLIGGSFAAALKHAGISQRVIGVGRHPQHLEHAQDLGLIDDVLSLTEASQQADLIFFATPVGTMQTLLTQLLPNLATHTLLMDAGSTKANVVRIAQQVLAERSSQFIPAHPIAGSEKSGADAAKFDLFQQRRVIITPLESNRDDDIRLVQDLWQALGAYTMCMDANQHDQVYASVSHLPHLIAYAYMQQVIQQDNASLRLEAAGTGFKDFTRLAASSPEMWRDVFLANSEAILAESRQFRAVLEAMEQAILNADAQALENYVNQAYQARKHWSLTTSTFTQS